MPTAGLRLQSRFRIGTGERWKRSVKAISLRVGPRPLKLHHVRLAPDEGAKERTAEIIDGAILVK
jgi:hypothetical protein